MINTRTINQQQLGHVIFIIVQKQLSITLSSGDLIMCPFSCLFCVENMELHRQRLARASSSCASLVSPLVTKTVDPDWSVSTEGTDRSFQLLCIHLALFNKRLCHPSLIYYCPSPFNGVVHSTGNCSIIFAQIPWPERVIQIPWSFLIDGAVLNSIWINPSFKHESRICSTQSSAEGIQMKGQLMQNERESKERRRQEAENGESLESDGFFSCTEIFNC